MVSHKSTQGESQWESLFVLRRQREAEGLLGRDTSVRKPARGENRGHSSGNSYQGVIHGSWRHAGQGLTQPILEAVKPEPHRGTLELPKLEMRSPSEWRFFSVAEQFKRGCRESRAETTGKSGGSGWNPGSEEGCTLLLPLVCWGSREGHQSWRVCLLIVLCTAAGNAWVAHPASGGRGGTDSEGTCTQSSSRNATHLSNSHGLGGTKPEPVAGLLDPHRPVIAICCLRTTGQRNHLPQAGRQFRCESPAFHYRQVYLKTPANHQR